MGILCSCDQKSNRFKAFVRLEGARNVGHPHTSTSVSVINAHCCFSFVMTSSYAHAHSLAKIHLPPSYAPNFTKMIKIMMTRCKGLNIKCNNNDKSMKSY